MAGKADIAEIAGSVLAALDDGEQIAPITAGDPGFDLDAAYAVAADIRARREARGERAIGRKIGFTNANIWNEYGVHAPIWGFMYDTSVREVAALGKRPFDPAPYLEPQIEPEIALGIGRAPEPDMDEAALGDCIEWIAHGCEIVQSPFPGWRFAAADTATFGLHGAYLIGPRIAATAEVLAALPGLSVTLQRDGETVDTGIGSNALGGPVSALRHLVGVLASDRHNPPLGAGEIVTTGTLTRAFPVAPGETWRTVIGGLPLPGLAISF